MEVVREEALRSVGHNLGKGNLTLEPSSLPSVFIFFSTFCTNVSTYKTTKRVSTYISMRSYLLTMVLNLMDSYTTSTYKVINVY